MPSTISIPELERLEQALCDAMVRQDIEALDKLTSDKLRFMHTNGKSQTKAEFLADRRVNAKIRKMESFDPLYLCCEGMAVVSNTVDVTVVQEGESADKARVLRLLSTYVWVEEPQGWRLSIRQGARALVS